VLYAPDLMQCSETTGDGPQDVSSHGDVQVEVNSQIADTVDRLDYGMSWSNKMHDK